MLRRNAYQRDPRRARRLESPVISVGNLAVGGSGKTPLVATLARLLADAGERPAVVSRGYGRRQQVDGALVVSDLRGLQVTDPRVTGDEPQMLARMLPGIPIVVCPDRYLAGRLAETRLAASIILLDDGFQHLQLARDVDLVLLSAEDLEERLLPGGRLREPLGAARSASALLVPGREEDVRLVQQRIGHDTVFQLRPTYGTPQAVMPFAEPLLAVEAGVAVAVAGIARPRRFFSALRTAGWDIRAEVVHRDHHWYTASDIAAIESRAAAAGASIILTTEKDAVRIEPLLPKRQAAGGPPWAYLPMTLQVEPVGAFRSWLLARVGTARR